MYRLPLPNHPHQKVYCPRAAVLDYFEDAWDQISYRTNDEEVNY